MQDFKIIIEYIEMLASPSTSFHKVRGLQELVTEWYESFEHIITSINYFLSSKLIESKGGLDWDVIADVTPEREKEIEQEKPRKKTSAIKKIEDCNSIEDLKIIKECYRMLKTFLTETCKFQPITFLHADDPPSFWINEQGDEIQIYIIEKIKKSALEKFQSELTGTLDHSVYQLIVQSDFEKFAIQRAKLYSTRVNEYRIVYDKNQPSELAKINALRYQSEKECIENPLFNALFYHEPMDQTDWIAVKQIVKNIVSIVTDDVKENEYQFSIMIYSNPNGEVKFGEMQFAKEEIEIEDQLGIPVAIVHNSSWNRSQQIANKIHREFLEFRVEMNENYNIFTNELHFKPA